MFGRDETGQQLRTTLTAGGDKALLPLITGVLTSCGRYDLLHQTLTSFYGRVSGPFGRLIIVEDGPGIPLSVREPFSDCRIEWISTGQQVGQLAAIDYAYSRITTPYVFHLEDDWRFLQSRFIEKSLIVLESNPKCLQVWLRALDDTQGHPVEPHVYTDYGVAWRRLALDYDFMGDWHGFSLNPGLRRMSDYIAVGGYGTHARSERDKPHLAESRIGRLYRERDFYAAILADHDGSGYIEHTGWGRHIGPVSW